MEIDEFSDDGFDNVSANVLQELENHALLSTQAQLQRQLPSNQKPLLPGSTTNDEWVEDDDLDTTEVTNDAGHPVARHIPSSASLRQQQQILGAALPVSPSAIRPRPPQAPQRRLAPPVPNPKWDPNTISARGQAGTRLSNLPGVPASSSHRFGPPQSQSFRPSQAQSAGPGDVMAALQQRLRTLESELTTARGEVSFLRSNSSRTQQQHEAEVSRLKRINAEQMAKQEAITSAAVAAEKHANTELQFLQQDMREAQGRNRRKDSTIADPNGRARDTVTTPKKTSKLAVMADGFDEMDIALSPSKGHGRTRTAGSIASNVGERTPSKGKRKRPLIESPVTALETHSGDDAVTAQGPETTTTPRQNTASGAAAAPQFDFLRMALDHACFHQHPPTFDVLSRFSFPAEPDVSFSAIIFQKLPVMGVPHLPIQLLVDFCSFISSIWHQCFEEQLWEPIKYLLGLIYFTFQLNTSMVAVHTVAKVIPVASETILKLAAARHRSPGGDLSTNPEFASMDEHVDTTNILSLLRISSLACATLTDGIEGDPCEKSTEFWKLVPLDLVLALLTANQRPNDVVGALDLLCTSVLPNSIGPIGDESKLSWVAELLIDRVSGKLSPTNTSPLVHHENSRLFRLAALRTLIAFASSPFGALQLASHRAAIPRLVICLSASLDELYDIPGTKLSPEVLRDYSAEEQDVSPFADVNFIISNCVLLIHKLVTDPETANIVDITQKLSTFFSGSQRYLIALGRLTFAEEDLIMEAGIESEVVEAAHELLEQAVTPDEGEIVSEAFNA